MVHLTGTLALVSALLSTAVSASFSEPNLVIRQEPGTPKYECHSSCGTAISRVKASSSVCDDNAVKENYNKCVACAGPDDQDIWKYYGPSLSVVSECDGVDPAPGSGSATTTTEATTKASTAAPTSTATTPSAVESSAVPAPSSNVTAPGNATSSRPGTALPSQVETDAGVANKAGAFVLVAAAGAMVLAL